MAASTQSTRRPAAPFFTVFKSRIRQPQFYWFLGHFLTIYHFARFHLAFFSLQSQAHHYKMVLLFTSVTYGIVLYQFYKSGQLQLGSFRSQIRKLDNLQYFIMLSTLAVCSFMSSGSMVNGSLYSPVIFSLFHTLNYFKENLLPFLPVQPIMKTMITNNIAAFISKYNGRFLQMAQVFEIMCAVHAGLLTLPLLLVIRPLLWQDLQLASIVANLCYVWFCKLRLLQSQSMKQILQQYIAKLDAMVPPAARPHWLLYKKFVHTIYQSLPTF